MGPFTAFGYWSGCSKGRRNPFGLHACRREDIFLETGGQAAELKKLVDNAYPLEDISCRLASGSFTDDAMVVAPCSIHTMSAIATGSAPIC